MYTLSSVARHHFPAARGGDDAAYVLDLHRTAGGGLVSTTSDQRLTLLDAARLGGDGGAAASWALPHGDGGVAALRALDGLVCTAGADGSAAVWDVRSAGAGARVAYFRGERAAARGAAAADGSAR